MAAFLIETRRAWLGAATLGLAGLGKETNLIAVVTLLRPGKLRSNLNSQFILKTAIAILPFVLSSILAFILPSVQPFFYPSLGEFIPGLAACAKQFDQLSLQQKP